MIPLRSCGASVRQAPSIRLARSVRARLVVLTAAIPGSVYAGPEAPRRADRPDARDGFLVELPPDHPARRGPAAEDADPGEAPDSGAWIRLPILLTPAPAPAPAPAPKPEDENLKPGPDSDRATYHELMSLGYRAYLDRRWSRSADFFARAAEVSGKFGEKEYFAQENLGDTLRVVGMNPEAAYAYRRALDVVEAQSAKGTKDIADRLRRKLALLPEGSIASARAYTPGSIVEPAAPPGDPRRLREELPELADSRARRARDRERWEYVHPYEDPLGNTGEEEQGFFHFTDPIVRFKEIRLMPGAGFAVYSKDLEIQNSLTYGVKLYVPMAFEWFHLYAEGVATQAQRTDAVPPGFDADSQIWLLKAGAGGRFFKAGRFSGYLEVGGVMVEFNDLQELKSGFGGTTGLVFDYNPWRMVHVDFRPSIEFSKSDWIMLLTFGAGIEF